MEFQDEYQKGSLINRLRQGQLDRDNVKAIAGTMEHRIPMHPPHHKDALIHGRRKFPLNSEYMEPNAVWSPCHIEDPWQPHYLDDLRKSYAKQMLDSVETLNGQEMIYAESEVYSKRGLQQPVSRESALFQEHPCRDLPQEHPTERSMLPRDSSRDAIYECLQPRSSIPELPPKLPSRHHHQSSHMQGLGRIYDNQVRLEVCLLFYFRSE